jgi:HD-like signal output (HDOD) protein
MQVPSMAQDPIYSDDYLALKIEGAPRLASLRSIGAALSELVYAENSFTSQIAEVIRRDPSLTSRLLKLVNSVFFGLSQRVNNIEEAIFYLGLRQIRELALATPIIEDFERLHGSGFKNAPWQKLWRHSIGCAIISREILSIAGIAFEDDTDYIIGLIHNVGKIVSASIFPTAFAKMLAARPATNEELCAMERELIGWDHARIGAFYLRRHHLGPEIIQPVRWHNERKKPGSSPPAPQPSSLQTTWCAPRAWRRSTFTAPPRKTPACSFPGGTYFSAPDRRSSARPFAKPCIRVLSGFPECLRG